MQKGTIEKLISYYAENDKFKAEMERAKNEFFDIPEGGTVITMDEKYMPFFMEWLVFDFRLRNNKSLVEDYYYRNPRKLPLYEMQVYKDLQNNVYGLIEVQKIYLDKGMDALMLHTGKKYFIYERSATSQLKRGDVIFGRIAEVNGRYELVSADSFKFDVRMDSRTKKFFIDNGAKFTPKDAVNFLRKKNDKKNNNNKPGAKKNINIKDLKKEFDGLLNEMGVGDMVNADLIQKWLANIDFKRKDTPIVDILIGLCENWPSGGQMDRLLDLTAKLANYSPQKRLKGKSPNELAEKGGFGTKGFDFFINRIGGEWPQYANRATDYLKSQNIPKAFNEYKKIFRVLLKEETTARRIFSVFANYGVCHLYLGGEFMARKLLGIALELNKNYEFAMNLLAEMDTHEGRGRLADTIRFTLKGARTKELKLFREKAKNYSDAKLCGAYYDTSLSDYMAEWERDPAKKYYDFLKRLEINFNGV